MDILKSKKFQAAIAGVIVAILAEYGLDVEASKLTAIILPIVAYIIGQGFADHGKEAAKIQPEPEEPFIVEDE